MTGIVVKTNVSPLGGSSFQTELPSEKLQRIQQQEVPQAEGLVPPVEGATKPPMIGYDPYATAEQDDLSNVFGGAKAVPPTPIATNTAESVQQYQEQQPTNLEQPTILDTPEPTQPVNLAQEELLREQRRLNSANIDWDSRDLMKQVFGKSIKTSEEGSLWYTRNDLADAGTRINVENKNQPSGTTGIGYLQAAHGLASPTQALNAATTSVFQALQILPATVEGTSVSESEDAFSFSDDESNPELIKDMKKEMTREQLSNELGKLYNQRVKAAKALSGEAIDESAPVDSRATGSILTSMGEDAGLFTEVVVDGKKVMRSTPKGTEKGWHARGMAHKLSEGTSGMSMISPAIQGTYPGALKEVRGKNKNKPSIAGRAKGTPQEVQETKQILGSIAKQIPIAKFSLMTMFAKLGVQEWKSGQAVDETKAKRQGAARLINLDGEVNDPKHPDFRSAKTAVETIKREVALVSDNFKDGHLRYSTYWFDNSTWRAYDDTIDANVQRSKWMRNLYVGTPTPLAVSKGPITEISLQQSKAWWEELGNNNWTKKAKGRAAEMSFLFTLGHVMTSDTDDKTPMAILASVTPEKIREWANIGRSLLGIASILTDGSKASALSFSSNIEEGFDLNSLSPEQTATIMQLLNNEDFSRENFGFMLQGYMDAYNYVQAKTTGSAFTPLLTTAIDMNSAGRAIMAMDIGNMEVLDKVGMFWEYVDNELNSTQPFGNPRSFFTDVCANEVIDIVFNSSRPEVRENLSNLFKRYAEDKEHGKNFTKAFSKAVLLTTDYGKAMQYHIDDANKFLLKYPEFAKEFKNITGLNDIQALKAMNELYTNTLRKTTHSFQFQLPKDLVRTLQMVDNMFAFKGMINDVIPLGANEWIPTGEETLITNYKGDTERIQHTKAKFNSGARGKTKEVTTIRNNELVKEDYTPEIGSAAANQIGPLFGQYRESMIVMKTLLALNKDKKPSEMFFIQPVFDNFVLDYQSLAQAMYYANNKALPEVLAWDIQQSVWDNFQEIYQKERAELKSLDKVIITEDSKYRNVLHNLDREVQFILDEQKKNPDKKLSERKQLFLEQLKRNGYEYVKDRDQLTNYSVETTGQKIDNLMQAFAVYKKIAANAKSWVKYGLENKNKAYERFMKIAKAGMVNFMN